MPGPGSPSAFSFRTFRPSRAPLLVVWLAMAMLIGVQAVRGPAKAATSVAFDAVGPGASGTSINGSSLSWDHTVTTTGSNLLLAVGVAVGVSPDTRTVAVTYNGVPMISAAKVHSNNQTQGFVELFYLTAPAPGTHPVQVTLAGGTAFIQAGSVSFTGVSQTTPVRNITTAVGAGTAPSVTVASSASEIVIDALVYGCGGGTSGTTLRWKKEVNCSTAGGNGAQSTAPGAPSVTMNYTIAQDWWGIVGMSVVAAPDGPPDTTPPTVPTGLTATPLSSSQVNLAWTPSTDDVGVTGYKVFRNGALLNTTPTNAYSDTGLLPATTYSYRVSAFDAGSNNSSESSPASATTSLPSFDFSLGNGGNKSVARGSSVANTIAATLLTGTTQPVSFTISGLPAGASGSFVPTSCSPTCSTTLTIAAGASTPLATSTITVTGMAGTLTRTTTFSLTVTSTADTTAPTVSLSAPVNNAIVGGTAITVSATASDNIGVAGVQFLLDGSNLGTEDTTTPYSITWNTTTTSAGPHVLSARARDAAGNIATAANVNVTVDKQPPTGSILVNGGAAATNSRSSTLTLSATDALSTVTQMRFSNTGTWYSAAMTYASTAAWTLSSGAGTKTVYAQFKDAVGNWSTAVTDTILYDATAPTISAVTTVNATNSSATVSWTTSEPATSQIEYGLTTSYGSVTPLDSTLVTSHVVTITGLSPNTTYNHRVKSADAANNLRNGSNRTLTTTAAPDTTPPTAPTNLAGIIASPTQINLSWTASTDNVAVTGYVVTRNGVQVGTPTATTFQDSGLVPGVYNYQVTARDAAGNVSPAAAVSVNFEPPRLRIDQPASGSVVTGGVVNVAYTALGNLTGVDHVHFTLDTNPMVMDLTLDGSYQFVNVPEGSHGLHGILVHADHSSIPGSDTSVSFSTSVDDTTPPTVSVTAPLAGANVQGSILLTASATDDQGVAWVQYYVDGNPVGAQARTAPYGVSWDSRTVGNGMHSITARATDIGLNVATSTPVSVTVTNTSQEALVGSWSAPMVWPLVAVHTTLLNTGDVLMWDDHTEEDGFYLWNPTTLGFSFFPPSASNLFCAGHTALPDGRTLIVGGTDPGGGVFGIRDVSAFDPVTRVRTNLAPMAFERYYPTAITLGDGKVLSVAGNGGASCGACTIATPEVYNPATNTWTTLTGANQIIPYYPHLFLLPDGRVVVTGTSEENVPTYLLNVNTRTWTTFDPNVIDSGSSVQYLPGKIMKTGIAGSPNGNIPGTRTAYVIDFNAPAPAWRQVGSMAFPRAQHMLTTLPDGTVLVTGGGTSSRAFDVTPAVYEAEIFNPVTETWTTMARMQTPRMYHGTSTLLPDGRVLVAGGGRVGFPDQLSAEIYSPPYLFKGPRPVIATSPSAIQYASTFALETPDSAAVSKVTLLKLGATTHAFNQEQRFLNLPFTVTDGTHLGVTTPANGNLAPPGYYMLFILDANGIPSVAKIVQIAAAVDTQAPTAPTGITAGGSLGRIDLAWIAATDNVGIKHYNVHRSTAAGFIPSAGNRIAQVVATTFTDSGMTGTFFYKVVAEDQAGNLGPASDEVSATATADTTAPSVAVTAPNDGAVVSGTVTVAATASDNVGVVGVTFFVDNVQIAAEDLTNPYSIAWDSRTIGNGLHQITSQARDSSGNIGTSALVSVTVQNVATAPGLVAAFGFDEGNGATLTDRTGSNHGTITGAAWTTGKYGSALSFNGVNTLVTIPDSPSLHLTNGVTVEAWVKPASTNTGWRDIVYRADDNYMLDLNGLTVYGGVTVSGSASLISSAANIPVNVWSHLAMTYDASTLKVYVNGVLSDSMARTGNISASTSPLTIGGDLVYGQFFHGAIDEVRVYNRALTQTEITTDMNAAVESGGAPLMTAQAAPASGTQTVAPMSHLHAMSTSTTALDAARLAADSASPAAVEYLVAFGPQAKQGPSTECSDPITGAGYVRFAPDGPSGLFKGFFTPRDGPVLGITGSRDGTTVYYTQPCVRNANGRGSSLPRIWSDVKVAGGVEPVATRLVFAGAPLNNPVALATDKRGNLIVGDNATDSLFRLSSDFGTLTEFFKLPGRHRRTRRILPSRSI